MRLAVEHIRFLHRCAAFESKMAELYRYFAKLFAHDRALALLWNKTAAEEENHAQQFNLAVRLQGTGMERVNTDLAAASVGLQKLEEMVTGLIGTTPSAERALELVIKLEDQVAAFHMSTLVIFDDQDLKKLFETMMDHDNGHISSLRDFLGRIKQEAAPLR